MNKQSKLVNGKVVGGIEWVQWPQPDGTVRQGFTSNAIGGCYHGCRWKMGDKLVICYAERTAEHSRAAQYYPEGFEHVYWKPNELNAWLSVKTPSRIFWDSMSDTFGLWIIRQHRDKLDAMLAAAQKAHWHTFQSLTKALLLYEGATDLLHEHNIALPKNLWFGASTPPDILFGKERAYTEQSLMMLRTLRQLEAIHQREGVVTWLSAEPLNFDIVPMLEPYPEAVQWIVIGAGSDGPTYYPPQEPHVRNLVAWCDAHGVAVFYKGNMQSLPWAKANWREDFPATPFREVRQGLEDIQAGRVGKITGTADLLDKSRID